MCEDVDASLLSNWPIKIRPFSPNNDKLKGQGIVIYSDCVAYLSPDFHKKVLRDRKLLIGCPKLDNAVEHVEKLKELISLHHPKEIVLSIMDIPCCRAFVQIVKMAKGNKGKGIKVITVDVNGHILGKENL